MLPNNTCRSERSHSSRLEYRSCGVLTTADLRPMRGSHGVPYPLVCVHSTTTSVSNWCQTTPYVDNKKAPGGEVVFVTTDCNSENQGEPHQFCFQSSTYACPGVSNNPDFFNGQVKAHLNWDQSLPYASTACQLCLHENWPSKSFKGVPEKIGLSACSADNTELNCHLLRRSRSAS